MEAIQQTMPSWPALVVRPAVYTSRGGNGKHSIMNQAQSKAATRQQQQHDEMNYCEHTEQSFQVAGQSSV